VANTSIGVGNNFSLEHYPYLSRRLPVFAPHGVVATSEPLAAQAGLDVLRRGGNAVDAAVTAAIALTVLEPTCNGIGGDACALIWDGKTLHGLNGSGRAPAAHTRELFTGRGLKAVPQRGWLAVTVPGAPRAWHDIHRRFGRLPFQALFEPAIQYAAEGFPVTPVTALRWQAAAKIHSGALDDSSLLAWREVFTRDGRPPRAGELWTLPALVPTLRELASTDCQSFYSGNLAARLVDFAARTGGLLTGQDLAEHQSSWVAPIRTTYRGHELWEMPPSSQGIAALTALNILDGFDLNGARRESVESYHLQIEAVKAALEDAYRYIADPDAVPVPWDSRLGKEFALAKRTQIQAGGTAARPGPPPLGGTVYLCTADSDGMMVSFMQSNYTGWLLGFGSGLVVPQTGIALHSRGSAFTLDDGHPNVIAPRKRPFHTLAPAFLTRGGRALGPLGIIGGPLQPQAHVQFVLNEVVYGLNPQANLDAPRFHWIGGNQVEVELNMPSEIMQGLVALGHEVRPCVEFAAVPPRFSGNLGAGGLLGSGDFGKAQMIRRQDDGVYVAASDWRAGGCAVGY
jgi:gamma-glutamyltranspeptidase/glutathione hydrolase